MSPWGRGDADKVTLVVLPSPCIQTHIFLALVVCWNFPAGPLDSHKGPLVGGDGDYLIQCSPGIPEPNPNNAAARTQVYMPVTRQMGGQDSFWVPLCVLLVTTEPQSHGAVAEYSGPGP